LFPAFLQIKTKTTQETASSYLTTIPYEESTKKGIAANPKPLGGTQPLNAPLPQSPEASPPHLNKQPLLHLLVKILLENALDPEYSIYSMRKIIIEAGKGKGKGKEKEEIIAYTRWHSPCPKYPFTFR
jgi:hypothetical protein